MFNQTTPGWMHWSSLPDTAGFLDPEGCKPPPYHHGLYSASAYGVACDEEQVFHGGTRWCKKNNLAHPVPMPSHTRTTALGWVVPPYKQECQKAPSATLEATDTDTSHRPTPTPHHHYHHAHRWQERHMFFRDASKTQRWRERSNSSAHRVHWETAKKSASSAGGVRIGNQSRISRGSWAAD